MKCNLRHFLKIEIKTLLNSMFFKTKRLNEAIHIIAGNFNFNLIEPEKNTKIFNFLNLIGLNSMIATINEPTTSTDLRSN